MLCPTERPTSLNQWRSPCAQESPPSTPCSSPLLSGRDLFFSENLSHLRLLLWKPQVGRSSCPDLPMGPQGKLLVSRSTPGEEGLCSRALVGRTGPETPWLGSPGQLAPRHHIQPQDHYQWPPLAVPPGFIVHLQVGGMRFVLDLWGQCT